MDLTNSERLNLKKLVDESDCENNTDHIRKIKHSTKIRADVNKMIAIKKQYSDMKFTEPDKYLEMFQTQCNFLFNQYTDIFNKLLKDELDLKIMTQLLIVLKLIEDNKVDQHEGSVMVGKILKELYVDSAMRRADNLDKEHYVAPVAKAESKPITWKQYKSMVN